MRILEYVKERMKMLKGPLLAGDMDTCGELLAIQAENWIGVSEVGNNSGPEVELFQKALDGKAAGEPWCCAFVAYCILAVQRHNGRPPVVPLSEHCLTMWQKAPAAQKTQVPIIGSLQVWQHGTSSNGHIGIVTRGCKDVRYVYTVEGNTSPDASGDKSVVREGQGVYEKLRPVSGSVGDMHILGYILPWSK